MARLLGVTLQLLALRPSARHSVVEAIALGRSPRQSVRTLDLRAKADSTFAARALGSHRGQIA